MQIPKYYETAGAAAFTRVKQLFLLTAVPASGHFPSLSVQPSTPLKSSILPRPIHLCPVIQTSTLSSGSPPSLTMTHHSHSLLRKAAERAPDLESEDWTYFLVLTPAEMHIFSPGEQLNCFTELP